MEKERRGAREGGMVQQGKEARGLRDEGRITGKRVGRGRSRGAMLMSRGMFQTDACHEKTDLIVFVVVMAKEGCPSFFWHDTDFSRIYDVSRVKGGIIVNDTSPKSEKSVSYQKKDGCGYARPSFFWYDNHKDLKVGFLVMRVTSIRLCCMLIANNVH